MFIIKAYTRDSKNIQQTRMHSSRMRTARLLPVSPSMHCSWGGVPGQGVHLVLGGCTWSQGGVPGLRGVYLVLGLCTWSRGGGGYLVPEGVPGPRGCIWSWGTAHSPRGCTWLWGVYLVLGGVPGPGGCTWSQGGVPGPGVYLVLEGVPGPGGVYLVLRGTCPGTPLTPL